MLRLFQGAALQRGFAAGVVAICAFMPAQAQESRNGLIVTVPNGYANVIVDDMRVNSTAGAVRWTRVWDGQEWKFNPQWESLSQSWKNLTGSQSADTTAGTVSTNGGSPSVPGGLASGGGGGDGCWVWVDEDWQPTYGTEMIGGMLPAGPMIPGRTVPFNRIMGEDALDYPEPQIVNIDYANLCAGISFSTGGLRDTEGIRRANELYLGDNGRYSFNNRSVLEKRAVRQLPAAAAAALYASLATGQISLAPASNAKGFRWIDKSGDWIDYNTQGQVVVWGDRNDNVVWLLRDTGGVVRGAVDANGRVVFSLHYTGELITEVRDYPAGSGDIAARSVKYQYDANNRLTTVTDVRGNTIKYDYDIGNHITKLTDQEGRVELLAYNGEVVKKRTAPDGGVTDYVFEYDDTNKQFASKITGPETASGRRVEDYTHNRTAKLVRQIVNGRTDVEIRYDTGARAETMTNARGFATRITRNEFDQVVQVEHPDGGVSKRSYSAANLMLTEQTDELGVKTKYSFDTKGNLVQRVEAAGTSVEQITDYAVNSLGQSYRIIRRGRTEINGTVTPDSVWNLEFDSLGQLRREVDPEGNARTFVTSRSGDLLRLADGRGYSTQYEVDATGNLTKVTDALGRIRTYAYDKARNNVAITDARSKITRAAYDALNRQIQVTNPVDGTSKWQYNVQGLPILETDEDGRSSRADFDNFLRVTREVDGLGNATTYSYDVADGGAGTLGSLGGPTQSQYPTFTKKQRYDARERLTSETLLNPNSFGMEGLVNSRAYDKRNQLTGDTDANGKTRSYAYDAVGRIVEVTDSLGAKTKAVYDTRGNLIQITDALGNVSRFDFDRSDRLVRETLPLGQTTVTSYDAAGNVQERTNANGFKAVATTDQANRVVAVKQYKAGNSLVRETTFTWDGEDNLVAWSDTDATRGQTTTSSATYDDAGRKTEETIAYPFGNSLRYAYAYTAAGYKKQLAWPDGTLISYGYSAHGELESVTIPGEGTISTTQFKWTEPVKVTLPGGSTQERTLDGLFNLEGLKVKTPGQQTVLNVSNVFGKVLELRQSNRTDAVSSGTSTKNTTLVYDDETRLTRTSVDSGGSSNAAVETFTLDAIGNRVAHSRVNGAWSYDANNRLLRRGTGNSATDYAYDEAGNLVQKTEPGGRITKYAYDSLNRLASVSNGASQPIARYGYDPLDRRIWKEQFRDAVGAALVDPMRTTYLYADEGLIAEASQKIQLNPDLTVTSIGPPVITAQYGPQPSSQFTTGILFVKTRNSSAQDSFGYFHHDQLGAPVQATDKAGNVVWAANYNVFGKADITTPLATLEKPTISTNLRLPGQVEDSETGLHYNYRRYYDPETGRYISQDPIGIAGGDNPYRYANASPSNATDPTGECPMCVAYAVCVAQCVLEDAATNAVTGDCNNWGDSAKSCATSCLLGPLGRFGKWFGKARDAACNINSFPGDTPVHVQPARGLDETGSPVSRVVPISEIQVGDKVLAFSEWKQRDKSRQEDGLSYEPVTDVFTSFREQKMVHLALVTGTKISATESHPFLTSEGWRDAGRLAAGSRLVVKGEDADQFTSEVQVESVSYEVSRLPVFNLEVANAHTYFVGDDGQIVHNGRCTPAVRRGWEKLHGRDWPKNPMTEKIRPGGNQDGHHIDYVVRGGDKTDPRNIRPMTPSQHTAWHKKHGYR